MIHVDVLTWVDACLAGAGRARSGAVAQVRDRPWGRVWAVPTDHGTTWLKEPAAPVRFEVALLATLARLQPRLGPEVLGVHEGARVLLADAGRTFRDLYAPADLPGPFTAALVQVGALQRSAARRVPDLLAAGVADLRPAALPGRFDELVDGLGPEPVRAADARAVLVDVCEQLARSAVPASIDHNDLHDANVLRDGTARTVVIDWGDSVLAHPFATLLVPQRVVADAVGRNVDHPWDVPAVAAARRAYLAGFEPLAPGEDLDRTARLAVTAAHVARAWVWRRALATLDAAVGAPDDPALADVAAGARGWLQLAIDALTGEDSAR
ncbi:phosphotransferase [Cellulomonas sp. JH27-2]|uniref:phosphotransferase n=1 Tax=Cellulomonas sp. JH27-2 TaxID=2774139 RepID=UPI00177B4068|nr:phosphotransferase [Cellulomonas sp. JH27-2]MBD8060060.1 phosphotransferase [Cellulomonas sp. JH27-2]